MESKEKMENMENKAMAENLESKENTESKKNPGNKGTSHGTKSLLSNVLKMGLIALVSLLLLIPLVMIEDVIRERENTKDAVTDEVAQTYAKWQMVHHPTLLVKVPDETTPTKLNPYIVECSEVNYIADVKTDILRRSIYDVLVYNSDIQISGVLPITENCIAAGSIEFSLVVSDMKGFNNPSQLSFGGQQYNIERKQNTFVSAVTLPEGAQVGDTVDFSLSFNLKGTEELLFEPSSEGVSTLVMSSSYPHPCFAGSLLPTTREVRDDGFSATWNYAQYNSTPGDSMGVMLVDPANSYQQSMRSVKYGMLIIVLVFVAALFVEFLTRRDINIIQYAVIGLSLVLFYSLLLSFSELMTFIAAYVIAASMTTGALTFYFRAILKHRSGYMLGGFIAVVYLLNYTLLQMDTHALLSGSLILFVLLCGVMYLTANMNNNNKELSQTK